MINKPLYLHLRNHKKIKLTKQKVLIADQAIVFEPFWNSKIINRKWASIDRNVISVTSKKCFTVCKIYNMH